jgi:hypothetical protein
MATWSEVEQQAPELAAAVRERFAVGKHATLATLRRDGSPRISGTEVEFADGQVVLGSMPDALKGKDLKRDPRFALHSPSVDPPEANPSDWAGEAKLAGTARYDGALAAGGPEGDRFLLDLTEVVFTRVVGDQLEIRSWHEGRGEQVRRRA